MKISQEEFNKLNDLYKKFFNDPRMQRMKEIPMHRGSCCFLHVFKVTKMAVLMGMKSKKKLDLTSLLVGAVFHDYYLYNWRDNKALLKHHGANHPDIAIANALQEYPINDLEREIIGQHMWPINLWRFPKHKEARIVSICDKRVALSEALHSYKYKKNKEAYFYNYLSSLEVKK